MIKLFSLEDFENLLSEDVVDTLKSDSINIEKLYESFREPGKQYVELDFNDLNDLFKLVYKTSNQEGYESGRESGWNDGMEQAQLYCGQDCY